MAMALGIAAAAASQTQNERGGSFLGSHLLMKSSLLMTMNLSTRAWHAAWFALPICIHVREETGFQ